MRMPSITRRSIDDLGYTVLDVVTVDMSRSMALPNFYYLSHGISCHMGSESDHQQKTGTPSENLPEEVQPREFLMSVQQLTGIGIWSHDPTTGKTWWSERAKELCSIEDTQSTFVDVARQHMQTDDSAITNIFATAVEDGEPFDIDTEFISDGSGRRVIRFRCRPHTIDDELDILYGTVRNITDEIRQEQRIKVLRQTTQRLKRADSQQVVAEILADASKNILGLVNTTIRLIDQSDNTLRPIVATEECVERAGERPSYPISEATPAARTYRTGEPELHRDHELTDDEYDRGELKSGLYVPIGDYGVLSTGDVVVDAFDEQDLEAASLLGQLGAEAITRIGLAKRSRAI